METIVLIDAFVDKGFAGNRPKILKIENKLFISGDGAGNAFVQELLIKE